jgi:uncharacterized RDD family membrane protein YckC
MSTEWQTAPQAPPGSYSSGPSGPRAGFWIRFGALILDGLIIGVPFVILIAIAAAADSGALVALFYVLYIVAYIVYPVYFEGGPTGATPGKKICGIKVIDMRTGGSIGHGRAFIRFLMRIVSAIPFYLGYLWMLWDKEKQCWHDKVADDVVVPADAYRS